MAERAGPRRLVEAKRRMLDKPAVRVHPMWLTDPEASPAAIKPPEAPDKASWARTVPILAPPFVTSGQFDRAARPKALQVPARMIPDPRVELIEGVVQIRVLRDHRRCTEPLQSSF